MRRASSADFVRRFSAYTDAALSEPLVLTRNGRDRLVVVGIEHYKELLALLAIHAPDTLDLGSIHEELKALSSAEDERPTAAKAAKR